MAALARMHLHAHTHKHTHKIVPQIAASTEHPVSHRREERHCIAYTRRLVAENSSATE